MAIDDSILASVAGRYAGALFDLANENGQVAQVEADLNSFQSLLDESEDLRQLVASPVYSADDQSKAVGAVLDKVGISGITANFIKLVASNRRLMVVSDMISAFRKLTAQARGEVTAEVASAAALSDAQIAALKDALKASVGKEVLLDTKVDPSLLGGLIVKIGSRMVDSSLRTKLSALKVSMAGSN